jgi:hypothetical protein
MPLKVAVKLAVAVVVAEELYAGVMYKVQAQYYRLLLVVVVLEG